MPWCCFCGGRDSEPYRYYEPNHGLDGKPDSTIKEELQWLNCIRIIAEGGNGTLAQAFMSAPARGTYGNSSYLAYSPYSSRIMMNFSPYLGELDGKVSFVFHEVCFREIFKRNLQFNRNGFDQNGVELVQCSMEILFWALRSLHSGAHGLFPLRVEYNMPGVDCLDFAFKYRLGEEHMVANPQYSPSLLHFYDILESICPLEDPAEFFHPQQRLEQTDSFSSLPSEIILEIMSYLPLSSLLDFRRASTHINTLQSRSGFWKDRLRYDMPWLYDLPQLQAPRLQRYLNWRNVYKIIWQMSDYRSECHAPGLVNRRRVWRACQQITERYMEVEKQPSWERILPNAATDRLSLKRFSSLLRPAAPRTAMPFRIFLARQWLQIGHVKVRLYVAWNHEGILSELSACHDTVISRIDLLVFQASSTECSEQEVIEIPGGDWIESLQCVLGVRGAHYGIVGIIFNTIKGKRLRAGRTEKGDHYLMAVDPNKIIIGFVGEKTSKGIEQLGLIQATSPGYISDTLALPSSRVESHNRVCGGMLWHDSFPELNLAPSGLCNHPDLFDTSWCSTPVHALVFSMNSEELTKVASIDGDVLLGAFRVRYVDGTQKTIGPRPRMMKSLSISGDRGERITHIYGTRMQDSLFVAIRTNWSRQIAFGRHPQGPNPSIWCLSGGADRYISGIFGSWGGDDGVHPSAVAVGAFVSEEQHNGEATDTSSWRITEANSVGAIRDIVFGDPDMWASDESQCFWDRNAPPNSWAANQIVFGVQDESFRVGSIFGDSSDSVAWLDLSKPVVDFTVWTEKHASLKQWDDPWNTAAEDSKCPLPLVSIIVNYEDGSRTAIGPDEVLHEMFDPSDEGTRASFCWSAEQNSIPLLEFESQIWSVGGDCVRAMYVWSTDRLHGLQFESVSGAKSPKFGECLGSANGQILFDNDIKISPPVEGGADAVRNACGIKFKFRSYSGEKNRFRVPYIRSLQALVEAPT